MLLNPRALSVVAASAALSFTWVAGAGCSGGAAPRVETERPVPEEVAVVPPPPDSAAASEAPTAKVEDRPADPAEEPAGSPVPKDSVLRHMPAGCDEGRIYVDGRVLFTPTIRRSLDGALKQLLAEAKKDLRKKKNKDANKEVEYIARILGAFISKADEIAACRTRLDSGTIVAVHMKLARGERASTVFEGLLAPIHGEKRDRDVIDGVVYVQLQNNNWTALTDDEVIFGRAKEDLVKAVKSTRGDPSFRGASDHVVWISQERAKVRVRAKEVGDKYHVVVGIGGAEDRASAEEQSKKLSGELTKLLGPSKLWDAFGAAVQSAAARKPTEPFTIEIDLSKKDLDAFAAGLKAMNLARLFG